MFDISNTGRRVVMILPKNMTVSRISQVGIPMSVFNEVFGRGVICLSNYDCQTVLPIIALIIFFLHVYLLNLDKSERSERISI